MITRLVWASCDGWELDLADYRTERCEKGWDEPFQTIEGAERALREAGWTVGKRVLCPVCIAALKVAKLTKTPR